MNILAEFFADFCADYGAEVHADVGAGGTVNQTLTIAFFVQGGIFHCRVQRGEVFKRLKI